MEPVGPAEGRTDSPTVTAEPETIPAAGGALAGETGDGAVKPEAHAEVALASFDTLEKTWGVKILGVRLSAAGHLLDFRYRVTDPEKAVPLFHRKTKPYLVDEASGRQAGRAKSAEGRAPPRHEQAGGRPSLLCPLLQPGGIPPAG